MNSSLEQRKFVVPEVIVGYDAMKLAAQYLKHFSAKKTMIVTDKGVVGQNWFTQILGSLTAQGIDYMIFEDVSSNPKDYEAMLGAELFLAEDCDSLLAVGGGSPMDCAKCISIVSTNGGHILDYIGVDEIRLPGPPLVCIPTTAGTSADVSQFAIITDSHEHIKKAIISKKVVPDLALIDPIPLMTMDLYLTACTGMDALTHAIEAYVSNASSSITDIHALNAIKLVYEFLPLAVKEDRTIETMHQMLLGSMHAGFAFSNASLGAVHALAHSLGGVLDLPHGECNSILLQRLIAVNFDAAPLRYRRIAETIGIQTSGLSDEHVKLNLVEAISNLREIVGIPEAVTMPLPNKDTIASMVTSALTDPCMVTNPKELSYDEVEELYVHLFQKR
ncbi:iron-containing alcohol dehydrogenase [Fusibacter bizertensis]|uniref:Iron-containing alcohol dehydrogenase n=1 Tax=Fusibacter bizertensis TaxID=1488331 RepID=A0ABT6NFT1_9FIRM|nr:iron-containing alcohol dehydrogenase [Fusibacter bizertensis]MDH8679247.1 iron-containing alcohol dehydrogenase [Fusibacter bizertensis]